MRNGTLGQKNQKNYIFLIRNFPPLRYAVARNQFLAYNGLMIYSSVDQRNINGVGSYINGHSKNGVIRSWFMRKWNKNVLP